ncbi:class I SAM-dependent methyltransferase [Thermodesulfobacteriota bacterium]
MNPDQFTRDTELTRSNREKLRRNKNLLYWYEQLYAHMLGPAECSRNKKILEVGSGTSPLKLFYPQVITSDILDLDYLDMRFDCMQIDSAADIPDAGLDIITMTNVLHHITHPVAFLEKAAVKLKPGGSIIMAEPFLSTFSKLYFRYLHHEPIKMNITMPELDKSDGPLSSANSALPYLIFFSGRGWDASLHNLYRFDSSRCDFFTSTAYLITGGISHVFPIPQWLYRIYLGIDNRLQRRLPNLMALFFIIRLKKK